MRNIKLIVLILIVFFLTFFSFKILLAKDNQVNKNQIILPDHPLYFLKIWLEKIRLFFTFDKKAKTEYLLKITEERLKEYQELIKLNKKELAQKSLKEYENLVQETVNQGLSIKNEKEMEEMADKIRESLSRHFQTLLYLYEKAPEPAREGIENALKKSRNGLQTVSEILTGKKRKQIQEKVKQGGNWLKGIFDKLWPVKKIKKECICTMEYNPVCGKDGKTYSNLCFLNCAEVELDYYGECQKEIIYCGGVAGFKCPEGYQCYYGERYELLEPRFPDDMGACFKKKNKDYHLKKFFEKK